MAVSILPLGWSGVPCAVRQMIGFDCPGCGLLRSWYELAHFRWHESLRFYVLGPLLYLGLWLFVIDDLRVWAMRNRPEHWVRPRLKGPFVLFVLGAIGIQWIVKLIGLW